MTKAEFMVAARKHFGEWPDGRYDAHLHGAEWAFEQLTDALESMQRKARFVKVVTQRRQKASN